MKATVPEAVAALLLAVALSACDTVSAPSPPAATLAIIGVTLIDGTGSGARGGVTVLVDGDRIAAVGPAADLAPPPGVEVVDGAGRFLIPGLWDAHVHVANEAEPAIAPEHQLALFLAHGVVAVRDMGSDWARIESLRQRLAAGQIRGPTIFSPGPYVDGPQDPAPAVVPVKGEAEARAAVRALAGRGADFLKIQATISRDAYFAAVDEARSLGLAVHGHVPDALTAREVTAAGQRTVEHVSPALASDAGIFLGCSSREDELRRELVDLAALRRRDDADAEEIARRYRALQRALIESYDADKAAELFARMRRRGTAVVPTLIWSQSYSPPSPELPEDLPRDVLPPAERERWEGILERYFAAASPEKLAANRRLADGSRELVGALHAAGVEVLAGTDSPFGFVLPGFAVHQELELLVASGLGPEAALAAAASGPSRLLGRLDERCTIEVGKRADLVLLDADPLADVRNTRRIAAVVAGGALYPRKELDRMLAGVVAAGRKILVAQP